MLLPGTSDLSVGVINISLGFAGLDALEPGQKGIEGFFSTKGNSSSVRKPTSATPLIDSVKTPKSETLASESKSRRTSSSAKKKPAEEQSDEPKRDFFNTAGSTKRKAPVVEVVDDSDSDIVEISPPPHAKRVNSGSSGRSEPRISTPTPAPKNGKRRDSGSNDKVKAGNGNGKNGKKNSGTKDITSFFTPRQK